MHRASPQPTPESSESTTSQPAAEIRRTEPGPAVVAAQEELGPDGVEPPGVEREDIAGPPDLGAVAIVEGILGAISRERSLSLADPVTILVDLSNQSHARPREFDEFQARFAALLDRAGEEEGLAYLPFEASDDGELATLEADLNIGYRLVGAAYLVTAQGFDQWELFLRLLPIDSSMTVWEARTPVRVLRFARPGHQQITLWPLALGDGQPTPTEDAED